MKPISENLLTGIRKILVLQQRQIGDVLLATPAIELLKKRFPEAELHVFTEKKCIPMLSGNPDISRIWAIDKKELNSLGKEIAFYRKVAGEGFDLVIDFQQLPRCLWVVFFSRSPLKISYTPPWYRRFLYSHWMDLADNTYSAHKKAGILELLGIAWKGEKPRLYLSEAEINAAGRILAESGLAPGQRLVTLDPTHRRITRLWPARHFARMIDICFEAAPDLRFLPLYGPGEEAEIEELVALVKHKTAVIQSPRMLGLREAAACMQRAALHVGNCSAPRHMATAVGAPTLTVLGSTDIYWDYPSSQHRNIFLGAPCQPCNKNECSKGIFCLQDLKPERVAAEALKMLEETSNT
ncbi:MAG: glycosyltransferase family 9 protein [Desulfovibrionaceae bacterium]|nr:glycosyltransferase family 9 protein [Desulfovibrionaceae bacterium]